MKKLWEKIKNYFRNLKSKNDIPEVMHPINDYYYQMMDVFENRFQQLDIDLYTNFITTEVYNDKKTNLLKELEVFKANYISNIKELATSK